MVDVNTQFGGFLTNLGAAKNTNANALGIPWKLTHMLIGDANGTDPAPSPGQTALVNQVYRAQLNQLYVSPTDDNVLIAELVLPPNVGGWWIRELALEDEDGVFSAVANCAPSYKPVLAQGSGRNQVVRMHIVTSGTANIQLKIDPSVVLATRAYCDGLIAAHAAAANPHPQYALRGDVVTLSATTAITPAQLGLVLLDAAAGNRTFTLPAANAALGVREVTLRRVDTSNSALVIAASGADKLMLDTTAAAAGQATTELLFAGDYLRLRSDGAGKWWCVGQAQLPGNLQAGCETWDAPGVFNWQVPAVLRSGRVRPWGSVTGSGGSGSRINDTAGGGGGGGGTDEGPLDLTGVEEVTITIAAGGVRQGSGLPGSSGSSSSIGTYLTATGGNGASPAGQGGTAGEGRAGKVRRRGSPGAAAVSAIGTSTYAAGNGGDSAMSGGGRAARQSSATAGEDGKHGSGGAGSIGSANAGNGGDGFAAVRWG